ncbi:glutamate 5-kinase [Rhodoligotrophos appendicifer]|uniref:glutamate 5-kinase n=1 Tax=Rhodoligotrophos appendicifer TaxID=987056 RepID=UPI00117F74E1|nr:glutamate 5-kinase [Rhodoligotrophos appendicifer]
MKRLELARRLVVKIGSALLVNGDGQINRDWLASLVADLSHLRTGGTEIVIVSSGAIALGRRTLGWAPGPLKLDESQAAAAVGQIALAHAYQQILGADNLVAAQILLTLYDTEERRRYLNARSTLTTLLREGAVPVINENDTVATSEIRYGDNDRLAARVSSMISADCLVLLSDIDGLYTAPPGSPEAKLIPEVLDITPEIAAMAGKPVSGVGSGGMITKIEAARIAIGAGAHMVIASGRELHPLKRISEGGNCTWFRPKATPIASRKRWIAGALEPVGRLVVDDGAVKALLAGRSLLPSGVRRIEGVFSRGDTVSVMTLTGGEIARGLVAYDKSDAERIAGLRSSDFEERLGWRGRDEMIHRDDLVVIGSFHHEPG